MPKKRLLRQMSPTTLLTLLSLVTPTAATYRLLDLYNSTNFFSSFTFFTSPDPTHGFVTYLSATEASARALAGYSQDGIYLGVDYTNVTNSTTGGRASVRVTSQKSYTRGLLLADITHMPTTLEAYSGCGLWPAYWTFGPDWPNSGEIDILEGVNSADTNSVTLHTSKGCTISNSGSLSGTTLVRADCTGSEGCSQQTSLDGTYGRGFNDAGGGVYAVEWTEEFIKVWFFPRDHDLTPSLTGNPPEEAPDPEEFGTPLAAFVTDTSSSANCSIESHFKEHQIVFDTTFCGDWAGEAWGDDEACSGLAEKCEDFVGEVPEAFEEAYWIVMSVSVWEKEE
ncbi:endo-1,3(4)-beta-glucanase-like protein [Thermochaetoides thermophila DSM 1495]|uniref:Endo-1,3(4)-beta-glucanase-like protein n=1 Tax=Chaetomium thermophilum (strain DSM 1495 / CBS 144.50 / IMI 039719) TaxID=759272 RepID=G0SEV3_CHATD|nr:endo-1,3(4)-beta-glucanase-like protein [Thermochaetoides thermophila DSM 1495]EGS17969.1 endo-1,3(4)-beta-glucanase-like protein [Thermochaetoides thermophila DSM 1495]